MQRRDFSTAADTYSIWGKVHDVSKIQKIYKDVIPTSSSTKMSYECINFYRVFVDMEHVYNKDFSGLVTACIKKRGNQWSAFFPN